MGNVDSRSKYDYGYMMVQTSSPVYNPGALVSGSIYLRIAPGPCPAKEVILEVKGAEKVSWTERVTRHVDGRTEHHDEKRKAKKDVFKYRQPCFQFTVPTLMPGDYTIPFQFQLPASLPSSINFKKSDIHEKPKAKVKYHIKAELMDHSNHAVMKYKQVLVLREQGEAYRTDISQTQENRISTWCCVDQGPSRI